MKREERARRFEKEIQHVPRYDREPISAPSVSLPTDAAQLEQLWDSLTIVGTSQVLEKPYLRLTSAPDPSTVRPLPVLMKALQHTRDKWAQTNDYTSTCDALKSIRQDLTVQRIKNEFTLHVYETHARIALQMGDLGEYNQCQSQLKTLYEEVHAPHPHQCEFLAYRILYLVHTSNTSEMNRCIAHLTSTEREHAHVAHSLAVRSAVDVSDYHSFFTLYLTAPGMSSYLMDQFVNRERIKALKAFASAYRPTISLSFIAKTLGFASLRDAHVFLSKDLSLSLSSSPPTEADLDDGSRSKKERKKHLKMLELETCMLDTKSSLPLLIAKCHEVTKRIDIKGQL